MKYQEQLWSFPVQHPLSPIYDDRDEFTDPEWYKKEKNRGLESEEVSSIRERLSREREEQETATKIEQQSQSQSHGINESGSRSPKSFTNPTEEFECVSGFASDSADESDSISSKDRLKKYVFDSLIV